VPLQTPGSTPAWRRGSAWKARAPTTSAPSLTGDGKIAGGLRASARAGPWTALGSLHRATERCLDACNDPCTSTYLCSYAVGCAFTTSSRRARLPVLTPSRSSHTYCHLYPVSCDQHWYWRAVPIERHSRPAVSADIKTGGSSFPPIHALWSARCCANKKNPATSSLPLPLPPVPVRILLLPLVRRQSLATVYLPHTSQRLFLSGCGVFEWWCGTPANLRN
jgi:hypothetical protein